MDKVSHLNLLQEAWNSCRGCTLALERKNVVFGYGNPNADIVIVGEAPGTQEDIEGEPFVGASGILLNQYLGATSANSELQDTFRDTGDSVEIDYRQVRRRLLEDFFITNIVSCHPPENRDPGKEEISRCRPRLLEIIYTVDPILIIAVGKLALETLTDKKVTITHSRGTIFDLQFRGREVEFQYPVLAMLHPSFLIRQNDFKQKGGYGERTYQDVLKGLRIVDDIHWFSDGIKRPNRGTK